MIFSSDVITPTKRFIHFATPCLIEAIYEDEELRRLVPQSDEMLGDIRATCRIHEEAYEFGEQLPEWQQTVDSEALEYAEVAIRILIDRGCIFAEPDLYDKKVMYFTGRAEALKQHFDLCVKSAGPCFAVLRIVGASAPPPGTYELPTVPS